MTEQFAECANANIMYEGDMAAFRDNVLVLLDRIDPTKARQEDDYF